MQRWLLVLLALAWDAADGNAWTRKKKEAKEEEDLSTDFARMNKLVEELGADAATKKKSASSASDLLDSAFDQWESLMETPEVQALLADPDAMKAAIKDNPLMANLPGVDAMLDSETFQDPEKFKDAMHQGMQSFKTMSKDVAGALGEQFQQLLDDPAKLQATVSDAMKMLGNLGDTDPADLLKGLSGGEGNEDLEAQIEQAKQYMQTLMGSDGGLGGSAEDLLAGLGDLLGGDDSSPTRKKRRTLEDDLVEIDIPDAINSPH
mmetsp:Transcript_24029/g.74043  ORF Transcript_24029/g.74043 Transcript_24029/m.74043 type:complete len:263 (+) Transcript_24029:61-849(+)